MERRVDKGFLIPVFGLLAVLMVISVFEYTKQQGFSQDNERLSPQAGNLQPSEGSGVPQEGNESMIDNSDVYASVGGSGGSGGGGGSAGSGGGAGGVSGGGGGAEDDKELPEELPSDLYTAPCGVYFEKYGVCAGSCPDGTCFSEGRSCYCKISE
jgi:hypothetical protein